MRHGGGNRWFAIAASLALHAGAFAPVWRSPPPSPPLPPGPLQVTLIAPTMSALVAHSPSPSIRGDQHAVAPSTAAGTEGPAPRPQSLAASLPAAPAPAFTETPTDTSLAAAAPAPASTDRAADTAASSHPTEPARTAAYTGSQIMATLEEAFSIHFYYPVLARRKGWEGDVTLALRVEIDGRLTGIHVVNSSGHRVLDNAAIDSLSRAHALPLPGGALDGGLDMLLPVRYRLLDTRV